MLLIYLGSQAPLTLIPVKYVIYSASYLRNALVSARSLVLLCVRAPVVGCNDVSRVRRNSPEVGVPGPPSLRLVSSDLKARRRNDHQALVEGHKYLTKSARVMAKKCIDFAHLRILIICAEKITPQRIRALAERDSVIFGEDPQIRLTRFL